MIELSVGAATKVKDISMTNLTFNWDRRQNVARKHH